MTVGLRLERDEVVGGWVWVCVVKTEGDVKKMGGNVAVLFVSFDTHTLLWFECSAGHFIFCDIFVYYIFSLCRHTRTNTVSF